MNRYLACTAALITPIIVSGAALAQTAGTAPTAPAAQSTMAPSGAPSGATTAAPAGSMSSMSSTAGGAKLSAMDKKFITKAAEGGMAEVQLAQLAQQKSQDDDVKKFAQKMIDDHTPANEKLTQLATSKGDTPPSDIDAADQKMMTKLQGLDGKKFDSAYLKGQVKAHQTMLKLFQDESKKGSDADLKAFADATVPTIQAHITMAQSDKTAM